MSNLFKKTITFPLSSNEPTLSKVSREQNHVGIMMVGP